MNIIKLSQKNYVFNGYRPLIGQNSAKNVLPINRHVIGIFWMEITHWVRISQNWIEKSTFLTSTGLWSVTICSKMYGLLRAIYTIFRLFIFNWNYALHILKIIPWAYCTFFSRWTKKFCRHVTFMVDWKFQNFRTLNGYSVTWPWKQSMKIKLHRTYILFSSIWQFSLATWCPKNMLSKKILTWIINYDYQAITMWIVMYGIIW